jgi:hypothetical protein
MITMYSEDNVAVAHKSITAAVAAARSESDLPDIELARILLNEVEDIVRAQATLHKDAGRRMHEPDFVSLAERIAGIVEKTEPKRQCR